MREKSHQIILADQTQRSNLDHLRTSTKACIYKMLRYFPLRSCFEKSTTFELTLIRFLVFQILLIFHL